MYEVRLLVLSGAVNVKIGSFVWFKKVNMRRATRSPVWWLLSLLVVARVSSGQEQAACTFCTCVGSPVIEVKNCNDALITIPSNIPTTVKNM